MAQFTAFNQPYLSYALNSQDTVHPLRDTLLVDQRTYVESRGEREFHTWLRNFENRTNTVGFDVPRVRIIDAVSGLAPPAIVLDTNGISTTKQVDCDTVLANQVRAPDVFCTNMHNLNDTVCIAFDANAVNVNLPLDCDEIIAHDVQASTVKCGTLSTNSIHNLNDEIMIDIDPNGDHISVIGGVVATEGIMPTIRTHFIKSLDDLQTALEITNNVVIAALPVTCTQMTSDTVSTGSIANLDNTVEVATVTTNNITFHVPTIATDIVSLNTRTTNIVTKDTDILAAEISDNNVMFHLNMTTQDITAIGNITTVGLRIPAGFGLVSGQGMIQMAVGKTNEDWVHEFTDPHVLMTVGTYIRELNAGTIRCEYLISDNPPSSNLLLNAAGQTLLQFNPTDTVGAEFPEAHVDFPHLVNVNSLQADTLIHCDEMIDSTNMHATTLIRCDSEVSADYVFADSLVESAIELRAPRLHLVNTADVHPNIVFDSPSGLADEPQRVLDWYMLNHFMYICGLLPNSPSAGGGSGTGIFEGLVSIFDVQTSINGVIADASAQSDAAATLQTQTNTLITDVTALKNKTEFLSSSNLLPGNTTPVYLTYIQGDVEQTGDLSVDGVLNVSQHVNVQGEVASYNDPLGEAGGQVRVGRLGSNAMEFYMDNVGSGKMRFIRDQRDGNGILDPGLAVELASFDGLDVMTARNIVPYLSNTYALGSPTAAWATVYTQFGTVTTSGMKAKEEINPMDSMTTKFASLAPKTYRYKRTVHDVDGHDEGAAPAKKIKTSMGFIAEDVAKLFPPDDYHIVDVDEKGEVVGIRYTELIAPLVSVVQDLLGRVNVLEKQLKTK